MRDCIQILKFCLFYYYRKLYDEETSYEALFAGYSIVTCVGR